MQLNSLRLDSQETWKIGKRMFERQTKIAADVTDIKDLFADHIVQRDRKTRLWHL